MTRTRSGRQVTDNISFPFQSELLAVASGVALALHVAMHSGNTSTGGGDRHRGGCMEHNPHSLRCHIQIPTAEDEVEVLILFTMLFTNSARIGRPFSSHDFNTDKPIGLHSKMDSDSHGLIQPHTDQCVSVHHSCN